MHHLLHPLRLSASRLPTATISIRFRLIRSLRPFHLLVLCIVLLLVSGFMESIAARSKANRSSVKAGTQRLGSLAYSNPRLKALRQEITLNLRSSMSAKHLRVPLRLLSYRLRRTDHFFTVMARTGQNADTLASLNDLPGPNAVGKGDTLLIPNARGLFLRGKRARLAASYGMRAEDLIRIRDGWFLPARGFHRGRRRFFMGYGFVSPLRRGRITSRFGMRRDPFTRRAVFHGGLDIGAPRGTPVFAGRAGVVAFAGRSGAYGKLIIINHAHGYRTYYGHLSKINVRTGHRIHSGKRIGAVGSTGRATGPHLHFEVRLRGVRKRPRFHRRVFRRSAARFISSSSL